MVTMIEGGFTMKILFYDTKSYDKESFDAALSKFPERVLLLYALLSAQT